MRFPTASRLAFVGTTAVALFGVASVALSAEPISVLILPPEGSAELAGPVAQLERQMREGDSGLLLVSSLGQAEVIVEFVGFKSGTIKSGEPLTAWYGRYLLIAEPDPSRAARSPLHSSPTRGPQPFTLFCTGTSGSAAVDGVSMLEGLLRKVLGRTEPPPQPEAT